MLYTTLFSLILSSLLYSFPSFLSFLIAFVLPSFYALPNTIISLPWFSLIFNPFLSLSPSSPSPLICFCLFHAFHNIISFSFITSVSSCCLPYALPARLPTLRHAHAAPRLCLIPSDPRVPSVAFHHDWSIVTPAKWNGWMASCHATLDGSLFLSVLSLALIRTKKVL